MKIIAVFLTIVTLPCSIGVANMIDEILNYWLHNKFNIIGHIIMSIQLMAALILFMFITFIFIKSFVLIF